MSVRVPASNGRTWSADAALSSTTIARRCAISARQAVTRWSRSPGIRAGGTPTACNRCCSAACAGTGSRPGVKPCRSTKIRASGYRSPSWCTACTTSAVLPTPAMPSTTTTWCPSLILASSPARPVKSCTSNGSATTWSFDGASDGASDGSALRMRACTSCSSAPGSTPSSSASSSRVSSYRRSASACLPARYNAISSSRTRLSRNGFAAARPDSSASTCSPASSAFAAHRSATESRSASSFARSAATTSESVSPARTCSGHRSSAFFSSCSRTSARASCRSTVPGSTSSTYPAARLPISIPAALSTLRNRDE